MIGFVSLGIAGGSVCGHGGLGAVGCCPGEVGGAPHEVMAHGFRIDFGHVVDPAVLFPAAHLQPPDDDDALALLDAAAYVDRKSTRQNSSH